jgi:hypothetical protein
MEKAHNILESGRTTEYEILDSLEKWLGLLLLVFKLAGGVELFNVLFESLDEQSN